MWVSGYILSGLNVGETEEKFIFKKYKSGSN